MACCDCVAALYCSTIRSSLPLHAATFWHACTCMVPHTQTVLDADQELYLSQDSLTSPSHPRHKASAHAGRERGWQRRLFQLCQPGRRSRDVCRYALRSDRVSPSKNWALAAVRARYIALIAILSPASAWARESGMKNGRMPIHKGDRASRGLCMHMISCT